MRHNWYKNEEKGNVIWVEQVNEVKIDYRNELGLLVNDNVVKVEIIEDETKDNGDLNVVNGI